MSYVSSAATEGLSSAFRVRAHLLLRSIQRLLNETHNSSPLTLAIYNSYLFNPQQTERAPSLRALGSRPAAVDKMTFARALMDAVGISGNDPDAMVAQINRTVVDVDLRRFVIELINRNAEDIRRGNRGDEGHPAGLARIQLEIANWFDRSTYSLGDEYRRYTQGSNFLIGLALAIVLGLEPLPPALAALAPSPLAAKVIGFLMVAISTLFGAPFWFALLGRLVPIKPQVPPPEVGASPPPAGPPAGGSPSTPSPPGPPPAPAPTAGPGTPAPAAPPPSEPPGAPPAGPPPSGPASPTPAISPVPTGSVPTPGRQ